MFQSPIPEPSQIDHLSDLSYRRRQEAERSLDGEEVVSVVLSRWQASYPRYGHESIHPFGTLLDAFKADRAMTTAERLAMASQIIDDMADAMDELVDLRLHGRA